MRLISVCCSTDWKARPDVSVETIGQSDERADLLTLQDKDVEKWQARDIEADIEDEAINADDEKRPVVPHNGEWADDERWEMERSADEDLRTFAGSDGGGGTWSITYHILD